MRFTALLTLFFLTLFTFSCETDLVTGEPEDVTVTDTNDGGDDDEEDHSRNSNNDNDGGNGNEDPGESDDGIFNPLALEALDRVNALRAQGCSCGGQYFAPAPALQLHFQLQAAAVAHSADQAARGSMGHVGSDGSRVGQRLTRAGFSWRAAAENVAWNQRSVEGVVAAWKNSAGHCRNMMNPDYDFMGFAVRDWYWTQVFAG